MYRSVRPYSAAVAAVSVVVLILGLITSPPKHPVVVSGVQVHAVQLAAAESPQASASSPAQTLERVLVWGAVGVALVGAGVALAPFWYVGFPVTVPLSILVSTALMSAFCPSPVCYSTPDTADFLRAGVSLFAGLPLGLVAVGALAVVGAVTGLGFESTPGAGSRVVRAAHRRAKAASRLDLIRPAVHGAPRTEKANGGDKRQSADDSGRGHSKRHPPRRAADGRRLSPR
jgi:hypothetical protein